MTSPCSEPKKKYRKLARLIRIKTKAMDQNAGIPTKELIRLRRIKKVGDHYKICERFTK